MFIRCLGFLVCSLGAAIQIHYIIVPMAVKNNTQSPAILDCIYTLRPDDTDLVVKWFLNDDLVYQWIPPQKPQDFGLLKNRIDLEYRAGDDAKNVYRAMKIKNPTTELAGEYRCYASTFTDEDFSNRNMIVFVPEKSLRISKNDSETLTNFTCTASEVYPVPKLIMYKDNNQDGFNKNRLHIVHWDVTKHADGKYTVSTVASAHVESLDFGTIIWCELKIPGTKYVKMKTLLYYPEDIDGSSQVQANKYLKKHKERT